MCVCVCVCIESYVSNSHIGFDPDYEVIKKTGLASNGTSINRIALLVVGIEQEVESEPFNVCLIFQNRVVQENKRDPGFLVPRRNIVAPFFFFFFFLYL